MRAFLSALVLIAGLVAPPARAAADAPSGATAIVLLREARLPDTKDLQAALEKRLNGRYKIENVQGVEKDGKPAILFDIAGGTAVVAVIDAPVPKHLMDDLCTTAWYWPKACETTDAHRAQLVVGVHRAALDKLDLSLLLTDVVRAAMQGNDNAVASYWMSALRPREMFLRISEDASRDEPPVWLWVNVRLSNDREKGVSASTDGLAVYGLREIEAKDVKRPVMDVFNVVTGTATYLVAKGPVIKDGDTVGASPALGIKVRYDKSYWREGADVYRVVWTK